MGAVEAGSVASISEALEDDSSKGKEEIAAFAISTQGLSALVARCAGIGALPAPLSQFLFEEVSRAGARARRLRATLEETVHALRASGVEVVALKGAALAFFHYPDPALRPMGDLDLLLEEPRDLERATAALVGAGWIALFDTPRHRVFARSDERVARPASEDPDNPIRIELHTSFRLPVLGRIYDASAELRAQAETRDLGGTPVAIAAGPALLRHLLFHAAEDFAGNGIRGIQAHDFRLLARERGAKSGAFAPPGDSSKGEEGGSRALAFVPDLSGAAPGPVLYALDAIERLFPHSFEESLFECLSLSVDPSLRARAAALPALRYTRPTRGWTRTLLTLVEGPTLKARFVLRVLFPSPGEVRANAAPEHSGLSLAGAYARILIRRIGSLFRGTGDPL